MRPLGSLTHLLVVVACFTNATFGQCSYPPSQSQTGPENQKTNNRNGKASLTPQQKQAVRLLRVAEVEAAGLSPEMRAFVLWKTAEGYEAINKQKEIALLTKAFFASQEIEDRKEQSNDNVCPEEFCYVKRWIQHNVLITMEQKSPEAAEQLLPQADPEIRDRISASLVQMYAANRNIEHAKALLTQFTEGDWYPYHAAASLMQALPGDSPDRLKIFTQAPNYFEQHKSWRGGVGMPIACCRLSSWNAHAYMYWALLTALALPETVRLLMPPCSRFRRR